MKNIVVVLTGAGISKSAGIPTFQDIPGITDKLSVNYKKSNPKDFETVMNSLKANCSGKSPTPAHLELAKYKVPIITMNIDGLHQAAGSEYVLEIHGNVNKDNVVLYGEQIHFAEESVKLLYKCGDFCRDNVIVGNFLIIGSSMQTQFANYLAGMAEYYANLNVESINENADIEVPKFLKTIDLEMQEMFYQIVMNNVEEE